MKESLPSTSVQISNNNYVIARKNTALNYIVLFLLRLPLVPLGLVTYAMDGTTADFTWKNQRGFEVLSIIMSLVGLVTLPLWFTLATCKFVLPKVLSNSKESPQTNFSKG